MESIAAIDNVFKKDLASTRLSVGMSYLNTYFLEALIQQLTQVCIQNVYHIDYILSFSSHTGL